MKTKTTTKPNTKKERFVIGSSRVTRSPTTLRAQMAAAIEHMAKTDRDIAQGARIKQLRLDLHLTQPAVAERCHVTLRTYQFWEAGDVDPSWENKKALAKVLGTTADYINSGPDLPDGTDTGLVDRLARLEEKLDQLLKRLPEGG
jgi:DNA-binding XRE family transcriptional regulator